MSAKRLVGTLLLVWTAAQGLSIPEAAVVTRKEARSPAREEVGRLVPPELQVQCRSWALAGEPVDLSIALLDPGTGSAVDLPQARFTATLDGSARVLPELRDSVALLPVVHGRGRLLFSSATAEEVRVTVRAAEGMRAAPEPVTVAITFLDPGEDADADGLTNLAEWRMGTDPLVPDSDEDGVLDPIDNCPALENLDQRDQVHPGGWGDACDDADGDGVADARDGCPDLPAFLATGGCPPSLSAPRTSASSFSLPLVPTDLIFDPVRPYAYVSHKPSRRVLFVNLETGEVEREFSFTTMPESLALTPDGSRLFAALLTREHDPGWFGDHEGYVASFDLTTQAKDRELRITEDPFDLLATGDGHLVVSSGSGQWSYIRVFDATSGQETGAVYGVRQRSRLALHPSETRVYAANTDVYPSDIERYDLLPGGGIAYRWDSPYHGTHRMEGDVGASPTGDFLLTRGGDLYAVGDLRSTDMLYLAGLSTGPITQMAWDAPRRVLFTLEGPDLHFYNLLSRMEIRDFDTNGAAQFLGTSGSLLYVAVPGGTSTRIDAYAHPVPGGGENTAPDARFTTNPSEGATTQTDVLLDASTTTDAQEPLAGLRFRWDLDDDGTWDTPFQASPTRIHRFPTAGTKFIRLQVLDSYALPAEVVHSLNVAFAPEGGGPPPAHPPFSLPFPVTDAVFDPLRPYLYVSQKAARKVSFVNLTTGFIERQFTFTTMPESLALAADGSRLFVALLTREHSPHWYDEQQEGYVAVFDLETQVKQGEFRISSDPFDLVVTSEGYLVVTSGSGQWTRLKVFNATHGQLTAAVYGPFEKSRLALHPSQTKVYLADTRLVPSDIERYDLLPGGGVAARWDSPYHGEHRMDGDVWASPEGDVLITRGGDVFTARDAQSKDMRYVQGLSVGAITQLVWDAPGRVILTLEGQAVHAYNSISHLEIGSHAIAGTGSFLALQGDRVFVTIPAGGTTVVESFPHPAPGGGDNTPPVAAFTVSPGDATTQTELVFDASSSVDAEDPLSALRFRWDLDADGAWDTPFQASPTVARRYLSAGTKYIRLQVLDSYALVAETVHSVNVAFEPDGGGPAPAHPPFSLPFAVTDAVFDPLRPYLYVSQKEAGKVSFVSLTTGFIERQFTFTALPGVLALSPDGGRLFVGLQPGEDDAAQGYVASFDLGAQVNDRQFAIPFAPYDLLATGDGRVVVSSDYGPAHSILVFDAVSGQLLAPTAFIWNRSRLALHPSGTRVYAADTSLSPSDIERFDLLPAAGIVARWDSPYHGEHRMNGNVWASPLGDVLITRGADVFTAGLSQDADMLYLGGLSSAGAITQLAWDGPGRVFFTLQNEALRYYNLVSRVEIGSQPIAGTATSLALHGERVFVTIPAGTATRVESVPHPCAGGADNTPPVARFTVSPARPTTQSDVVLDASASTDAEEPSSALLFRWDLQDDGTWDTPFQASPVMIHRYDTAGTKFIRLQVRDRLALVADLLQAVDVFSVQADGPGPARPPFALPFLVTDAAFDPVRPYLYVSQKEAKKVSIVNLTTGLIERQFTFSRMPESLAVTPDGSRLFVALLTREHSPDWWDWEGHEGYIASIDLATQAKDREFRIAEDPYDLLATAGGRLVVASGSGQWSRIKVFDGVTGEQLGPSAQIRHRSRLALHPSETKVYAANTDVSPMDIERFDLLPAGGIVQRWNSPYHGHHRMEGNVWATPLGDALITRGGDVFAAGDSQDTDMEYLQALSPGTITDAAADAAHGTLFTLEGSSVRWYDLLTRAPRGAYSLSRAGAFLGSREGDVFALVPGAQTTDVQVFTRRPTAQAGLDLEVECEGAGASSLWLDGSASTDPDSTPGTHDDIVAFDWFDLAPDGSRVLIAQGESAQVGLSVGDHRVLLRVVDRLGHWGEDEILVRVKDTIPPQLSLSVTPAELWPPNHRLVEVHVAVIAQDSCTASSWTLGSVTSSQADDAPTPDDGDTAGDIRDAEVGAADTQFLLRAERAGSSRRVYTAVYEATDASGNRAQRAVEVVVPHDQAGGATHPDLRQLEPRRSRGRVNGR